MTPEFDPTNQDPSPRDGTGGEFVCSICNTTFPAPGFDAAQLAQALTRHIAANHPAELGEVVDRTLDAAANDPSTAADPEIPAMQATLGVVGVSAEPAGAPEEAALSPGEHETSSDSDETDTDNVRGRGDANTDTSESSESSESSEVSNPVDQNSPTNLTNPSETPSAAAQRHDSGPPHKAPGTGDSGPSGTGGGRASVPPTAPVGKAGGPRTFAPKPSYAPMPQAAGSGTPETPDDRQPTATPGTTGQGRETTRQDGSRAPSAKENATEAETTRREEKPSSGSPKGPRQDNTRKDPAAAGAAGKNPSEMVKQKVQQTIQKGLEAAGSSVGIPPQFTRIAIKVAKRVLPIAMAMVLVFLAALAGGSLFGGENAEDYVWDIPLSEQLDIPEPYLDAYRNAARTYKLPWTLLAAVGANASYHGRIDPYKQEVPLPSVAPEEEDAEKFVLLTDADLSGVETYLNPLLLPAGYSVEVVELSDGTIGSAVTWLDENNPDNTTPIVVALGTSGATTPAAFADEIDRILNLRGLHNRIHWVTIATAGADPYNQVLRERDRLRPNLTLIDWAGTVTERGIAIGADGSIDDSGQRLRAGLIAAAITGNVVSAGLPVASNLSGPGVLPTPTGTCPTLAVPIEGESASQGAGPLMLAPASLNAAGYDLGDDIQNICDSVDALAEVLAQTARIVAAEEGTSFPGGIANLALQAVNGDAVVSERVHKFWAKVVDASGVLGDTVRRECTIPEQGSAEDQAHVGNVIDAYWRCTLASVELFSVTDVSVDAAGNVSHRTLNQPEAVTRAVDEALSVAWTWSSWGAGACDEEAVNAGVFPLTRAVFAAHAENPEAGRCDREQNIVAAAKAFAAEEGRAVDARGGRWNASIGGWGSIGPVGGPPGPTLFDTLGPWRPLYVNAECTPVVVDAVVAAGNDAAFLGGYTAAQAQEVAFAGTFDEYDTTGVREGSALTEDQLIAINAAVDTVLGAITTAIRANPVCAQERPYSDEEWLGVLAGTVNGDALTAVSDDGSGPRIPGVTRGDLSVAAAAGDRIAALSGRAASRSGSWAGIAPENSAYLQRLSTVRVALTVRPLVERELGDGTLSIGYRLVNLAVGYYGGIFIGNDGVKIAGIGFVDETVPFNEEFNSVGQEYGVDPRLLAAVARQESNFNPDAGCDPPGGAFGMMQKEYDTVPTLCGDVRRQIEEAAKMLLDLYERAGDWKGALWGYNNGALFADTWAEIGGDVSAAEQFAYQWYRSARNPTTGQLYCSATGECARAEIAMKYISETPGDRSAMLGWLEYQGLFPALVLNTRQTVVNGTECPNVAPQSAIAGKETLRGGAGDVGIRELCVEAVAEAPTAEAARAIIFAFSNLGITYSQPLRSTPTAFDCSSYVSRSYESAGLVMNVGGAHFNTRQLLPWDGGSRPEWVVPVSPHLAKPGDLVFPAQGHVAMKLTRGFIIHTNSTGDVSHVTLGGSSYVNPLQTNRVVPELAPRLP